MQFTTEALKVITDRGLTTQEVMRTARRILDAKARGPRFFGQIPAHGSCPLFILTPDLSVVVFELTWSKLVCPQISYSAK